MLFLQLHIYLYILRNSTLHTGIALLELRITINICVLNVCFVTVLCFVWRNWDKHAKKQNKKTPTTNNCKGLCVRWARSVITAYKPCLFVHTVLVTLQPPILFQVLSLSDEGIAVSQNQGLHMKAFFFFFLNFITDKQSV